MHLPNYKDGSIVNLMSSIMRAYGERSEYGLLRSLDLDVLRKSINVILFVIDGLGYEFLLKNVGNGILKQHLQDKITSVFPSTTATGVTTFLTGLAPQQHAITGWFMFVKELGLVTRILPFNPRYGGLALSKTGIDPMVVFNHKPLSARLKAETYYLIPQHLFESDYTTVTSTGAEKYSYQSLDDCLRAVKEIVGNNRNKKFMYVYWSELDSLSHEFGLAGTEVISHLRELDHSILTLVDALKGSSSVLLITSDHGLVDTETMDRISLEEHPELAQTLTLPLCGEPRAAYCYVHPSKARNFRDYVHAHLGDYCHLYASQDLIRRHFFGLHTPDPRLQDRIGDYVLIMKEHYVLKDFISGEPTHFLRANHGGVSSEEMYVPLINIPC